MAARARLVDAAVTLMRRHGVAGASVSAILARAGLARRTLYVTFPDGKPALMAAATDHAAAAITAALGTLPVEGGPRATVRALVAMWSRMLRDGDFRAGCPIAAAALARDEAPDAADRAATAFVHWAQLLAEAGRAAGMRPERADDLATTVIAAVEGAVIMCIAARGTDPLERVGRDLDLLVDASLARAASPTAR